MAPASGLPSSVPAHLPSLQQFRWQVTHSVVRRRVWAGCCPRPWGGCWRCVTPPYGCPGSRSLAVWGPVPCASHAPCAWPPSWPASLARISSRRRVVPASRWKQSAAQWFGRCPAAWPKRQASFSLKRPSQSIFSLSMHESTAYLEGILVVDSFLRRFGTYFLRTPGFHYFIIS